MAWNCVQMCIRDRAVTMVVAAVITGAAMRVEVHRLNSTRR